MLSAKQCDMSRPEQVPGVAVDRIREARKRWGTVSVGLVVCCSSGSISFSAEEQTGSLKSTQVRVLGPGKQGEGGAEHDAEGDEGS
jgi:hypothetical protein